MIYLSGCLPSKPEISQQLIECGVGILLTPYSQRNLDSHNWKWAADNGCFAARWEHHAWLNWLQTRANPQQALFAVVPDTVCNPIDTTRKWELHHQTVAALGYKTAYVLQDGATNNHIPWEQLDCLFIGGSTQYKLSDEAKQHVKEAKRRNKWVHMGRVNSQRRIELAHEWGCDSADGTFLAFGPDINTPKLVRMIRYGTRPQLELA